MNSADCRSEATLSKRFTGRMVCMPLPTSPSRITVPLMSCRAAHEFFLLCEPRNAGLAPPAPGGLGGLSVCPSNVVCRERALRGVWLACSAAAAPAGNCAWSKNDCSLALEDGPVAVDPAAEPVKMGDPVDV